MSISHHTPQELAAPIIEEAAEQTRRVRWRHRGDTLPARCANSFGRVLNYLSTLDSEREPGSEYYARKPRTVRELIANAGEAVHPTRIFVAVGELAIQARDDIREDIQRRQAAQLPELPPPGADEPD